MEQPNPNMNAPHVQHDASNYGGFLNGITDYSAYEDNQPTSNEDGQFKWDPELFAAAEAFTHPSSDFSQAFVHHESRQQSNSPALPAYTQQQHGYPQSQYHQQSFPNRAHQVQPTYTSQFLSRPPHSPAPYEQYQYQNQIPQQVSNFNVPQAQPPRQSSATPQGFVRQAPYDAYGVFNSKPSPLQQTHAPQLNYFHEFPDQGRQATSRFVDPSVLSTSTFINPNLSPAEILARQRQIQANSQQQPQRAIDPRATQYALPQSQLQQPGTTQQAQPFVMMHGTNAMSQAPIRVPRDPNAPKRPRGRPRKDGTAPRPRTEGQLSPSESESEDELQVEEEPPEVTPAILTVSAPTDERGKALYSAVQAVWTPRNRVATPEKIRNGIASFGEVVRGLRDSWKTKNDNLKKAELPNSATAFEAAHLKDEVQRYRASMESIMIRANHFGHPSVVKRLGENQFAMSALYSFLLDRFNAGDYDSSLVISILKFATRFETLDDSQLETTKWSKILQRFAKKATNESKEHAQTILNNAAKATASKGNLTANGDKPASPLPSAGKGAVVGVKRTAEGEVVSGSVPKKLVKTLPQSSKPLALQNAERRKALEKAQASRDKDGKNTAITASALSKPKVAAVAPTKSAVFSALMSASKKPGTSNAARAAAAKEKPVPGAVPTIVKQDVKEDSPSRKLGVTPAGGASSFMGFLADMEKKVEPEVKKEIVLPEESEEAKATRLRKEARRKLRVSWRADADLVETRLFTHDPEEESGQTDSMMRDAGDTGKEGEMLKLHKGLDDLDDDDEEEDVIEDLSPYTTPTSVDVSEAEEDFKYNFIKFNGPVKPESTASEAQNKHEDNNLMVVYATGSERPNTPREPEGEADEADDVEFQPCVDIGEPEDKTRKREQEYLASIPKPTPAMSGLDFAAQLRAMSSTQPAAQPNIGNLQQTLTMLGGQPQQPQAPAAGADLTKLLSFVQNFQQLQQQPQAQPAYQAPQTPTVTPNLAALLAQMSGQPQVQPLPVGNGANPNPFPGAEDPSRKHARGDSADDYGKKNKKKKGTEGLPYNYKTQVCTFWLEGKCIKGDSCTYRHDSGD